MSELVKSLVEERLRAIDGALQWKQEDINAARDSFSALLEDETSLLNQQSELRLFLKGLEDKNA